MGARLFGLVFAALAVPALAAGGWSTFKDPDGAFQIDLPQAPQAARTAIPLPTGGAIPTAQYLVGRGNLELGVLVNDFTALHLDAATALSRAVNSSQAHGRTLVSNTALTVGRHQGRDLVLTDTNNHTIETRIFFFDNRLFQVMSILPREAKPDDLAMVKRYGASLRFLK